MRADVEVLEAAIGHSFQNREFLLRALTHTSHAYEKSLPLGDNEQLEFLGDAILGFLVSEHLIDRFPSYREGRLSVLKNFLVSASHLHDVAQKLSLGEYLLLGRGEEMSGGRVKKGLLADAVEALIASIYLDGGLEAARRFVVTQILSDTPTLAGYADSLFANFKGALQEIARSLNLPAPRYAVISEHGPAHARRFVVEARIGEEWVAQGEGDSKKSAGQQAAQTVLKQLMARVE
jgi:ribonuclease-3